MASKHKNRCSTLLVNKETQIKTTTLCHHIKWRREETPSIGKNVEHSDTASSGSKLVGPLWKVGNIY